MVGYFAFSMLFRGEKTVEQVETDEGAFPVVVKSVSPAGVEGALSISGRTAAVKTVTVRAETPGTVAEIAGNEGEAVARGDVLCRIAADTRNATVAEARAAVSRAQIDYDAAKALADEGFGSGAAVAATRAALDQARAGLERARLDLANTAVRAPFDGILESMIAEPGDFLAVGGPCAIIADLSAVKFSGSVAEKNIDRIAIGAAGEIMVDNGQRLPAKVTYVSPTAANATRSYTVELEAENTDGRVKVGQTATATIFTGQGTGWRVPRNAVVNNDEGLLGVRVVEEVDTATGIGVVRFYPVRRLGDDADGLLVDGLSGTVDVIVRGQDYVTDGKFVAPQAEDSLADATRDEAPA